jgi:hypothetical protein
MRDLKAKDAAAAQGPQGGMYHYNRPLAALRKLIDRLAIRLRMSEDTAQGDQGQERMPKWTQ